MTITYGRTETNPTTERMTIQAYLTYDDGTDDRFELVDGELVRIMQGTGEHHDISQFLQGEFSSAIRSLGVPWVAKMMAIAIQSPRGTRWETARVPDVVVLPREQWQEYKKREAFIPLNDAPPLLVVEVVSPSTIAIDYRTKHSEYAVLDIAEYWIVDPIEAKITVCTLVDGAYNDRVFVGAEQIESPTFGDLDLTVAGVLAAEG
jgi:Uma2 family endonuclease